MLRKLAIALLSLALGAGTAFGVSACGEDREGDVEIKEGATTGGGGGTTAPPAETGATTEATETERQPEGATTEETEPEGSTTERETRTLPDED